MATPTVHLPECIICCEGFKIPPKFLPCGHSVCLSCIESIAERRQTFPCPFCKQNIDIPEGGAKNFPNNFIVQQSTHTSQPKCPNHNDREVDYFCNNCYVGLCSKCAFQQHKDHKTLDIECEETRNKAIEKLQRSQNLIQHKIKILEKSRSTLLQSFEQLKSLCEDSCAKMTETTERIVSDLRKSCKQIKRDIRKNLEENRSKVEDREMEMTSAINLLESNIESNISPSTKTLNILLTLPRLIQLEKLDESGKDLTVKYLQWTWKHSSWEKDQLGWLIPKPFYIPGSYQFVFDISDIEKDGIDYYSKDTFTDNNLVWSCYITRDGGNLCICIELLLGDNPKQRYCVIDYQISLLHIDDSKTLTETESNRKLMIGGWWGWGCPITWSKLTDKNIGFLNSKNQFVVQFDITQIRKIRFSE